MEELNWFWSLELQIVKASKNSGHSRCANFATRLATHLSLLLPRIPNLYPHLRQCPFPSGTGWLAGQQSDPSLPHRAAEATAWPQPNAAYLQREAGQQRTSKTASTAPAAQRGGGGPAPASPSSLGGSLSGVILDPLATAPQDPPGRAADLVHIASR